MIFLHQRFSAFIFHCDRGGIGYNYLLNAPDHVVQTTAPQIPVYASAWRQRHQLIISGYHDAVNGTFTHKRENTASVKDRFSVRYTGTLLCDKSFSTHIRPHNYIQ